MNEKMVPSPSFLMSREKRDDDSLYPMYFGVSCAFFAVRLLSLPREVENEGWSAVRERMLKGSAQLLGLLVWRVQREGLDREIAIRLKNAERDVAELKRIRREDAKANEKVVGIFAAQEQSWLIERKKLRQHIGALMNELRFQEKRTDQIVTEMNDKLKEMESLVQNRDKDLAEECEKRKDLEQKVKEAESSVEELREKAKRESQDHCSDLRKHKTAFIELVSNQRHLEAEMSRAMRQVEAKKRDLESVLKQKEESVLMVQKLSAEMVKMHEDLEQKDKILSAALRKSKLDMAEKQLLLKEVKLLKAKRKQAELETERWKTVSESRHERNSLRNMFAKQTNSRLEVVSGEKGSTGSSLSNIKPHIVSNDSLLGFDHLEVRNEDDGFSPHFDDFSVQTKEGIDVKQVENWVRSEAERYATVIEQRHRQEIDAFVEQLRLKDEKLEAFRWRLLSMELESKRLQPHVEGLNKDLLQMRHNGLKMESILMGKEEELASLKEKLASQSTAKDSIWQQVKIVKRHPGVEEDQEETKTISDSVETSRDEVNERNLLTVQSPDKEFEDQKATSQDRGSSSPAESIGTTENLASPSQQQHLNRANSAQWKLDLHSLGVSYKLKRLKQQFVLLERLRGKKEDSSGGDDANKETKNTKDFVSLMALLNKQIGRYQSLQVKVDDLCKRMHESDLELCREDAKTARTKEKTKILEHFLEETFQLQRYIVATGQKLMEIQAKISSGFVGLAEELDNSTGFDTERFTENVRSLFHDVQRGIEVRIARVIGDLEGTLACEGMIRLRR